MVLVCSSLQLSHGKNLALLSMFLLQELGNKQAWDLSLGFPFCSRGEAKTHCTTQPESGKKGASHLGT